jgi:ATP-binding cassette subfamily B protein
VFFSNNEFNEVVVIFGIFAFAAIRMLPNLVQIIRSFQVLKFNYPAINTVYNGLRKNNKKNNKKSNFRNIDSISFNKVNFAYPEKSISTLDNVNFKLKAGDKVGIIGETGSGKTTLINLISGLLLPTKGKILINSKNYINSEENKMNIGYVSQFVYVVDDSILFNIALSEEVSNKSKNFIIKLLQILNLKKLSNKNLRSPLGERGSKLSGGQIQRIGIARALYREPSILILDEATNALDDKTENKVLDYLFDKFNDKIIIFCTHKKKLLKYCTKIIEVKNKKIKVSNK